LFVCTYRRPSSDTRKRGGGRASPWINMRKSRKEKGEESKKRREESEEERRR
jgi:hypothetical protein